MDNHAFEPDIELKISNHKSTGTVAVERRNGLVKNETCLGLKREIGLFGGVAMVAGSMIGSGIFVTPGGVLEHTGAVWMNIIVWVACGIASACGAICYIELGTVLPVSGAEYTYISKAFGSLPGFLVIWISFLVLKPASVAIGCLAFAQYLIEIFTPIEPDLDVAVKLIAFAAIFTTTFINCKSVTWSCNTQVFTTCFKLVAFSIVIFGGIYNIALGKTEHLKPTMEGAKWDFGNLALAFYSSLWAYDGWNQLNYVTEEVKNPDKILPKAVMVGLPLVTLCYVSVNIAFLTLMSPEEFIQSSSAAVEFGKRFIGPWSAILSAAIAMSTFGTAHGQEFTSSRMTYAAGREGHLMSIFSYIHVERSTPVVALIFNSLMAILMALTLDIKTLVDFFTFTAWMFYGTAMASLIRLRVSMPHAPRPFKVPIVIPWVMVFLSIYLVLTPIIANPRLEFVYSLAFIVSGLVVYIPFVRYGLVLPGTETTTRFLQLILNVAPPTANCVSLVTETQAKTQ